MNISSMLTEGQSWAYRAVRTQTNVAQKTIGVKISPRAAARMIITEINIGADDYGANRVLTIQVKDSVANLITRVSYESTLDNASHAPLRKRAIAQDVTDTTPNAVGTTEGYLVITGTDYIQIAATDLAQNETLTVLIRAIIHDRAVEITEVDADNTSTVETYNKTI